MKISKYLRFVVIDRVDVLDKRALLPTVVPQGVNFLSLVGGIKPGDALVSTAAQLVAALLGLKLIQMQGSGVLAHDPRVSRCQKRRDSLRSERLTYAPGALCEGHNVFIMVED